MYTETAVFARTFQADEYTVSDTHPLRVVGVTFKACLNIFGFKLSMMK